MLRLETFGGLTLTSGRDPRLQPRRRLALFARLAAAGQRGVGRDELLTLFWPERDIESARHSLDQLLYEARRSLCASPTCGTATLRLDRDLIATDVGEWSAALLNDDLTTAAALYRGPFLQGFYLNGSSEFERWVQAARAQMATEYQKVLEKLATRARDGGELSEAVALWRRLVAEDRFGARTALGLMRALADAGDRAGALEFSRVHERIMRAELDSAPDPAVAAFADVLRSESERPFKAQLPTSNPPRSIEVVDTLPAREIFIETANTAPADSIAFGPRPGRSSRGRTVMFAVVLASLIGAAYLVTRENGPPTAHAMSIAATRSRARSSSASGRSRRLGSHTRNVAAHDLFERGEDPRLLRSDSGQRAAINYLREAVALDTSYTEAYAMLASRYSTFAWASSIPVAERHELLARAETAARHAIELDSSLAAAHCALGYVLGVNQMESASLAELKLATTLDPMSSDAQEMLTKAYEWNSRPDDAVSAAERAVAANPLSATANAELGEALYFARRYDEALAQLSKLAAVDPPLLRVPVYLGEVYGATGEWPKMIGLLRPKVAHDPRLRGLLGYALARVGKRAEATELLTQMLTEESAGLAPASAIAEVYVGLGDFERAFVWLDRSFDDYSLQPGIMGPLFDELHADPRFEHVRQRLGITGKSAALLSQ